MEIIEGYRKQRSLRLHYPVLTVGTFDGLHLGHMEIINGVVRRARMMGGAALVFTFRENPLRVLQPNEPPERITPNGDKMEILSRAGVDFLILVDFSIDFANIKYERFIYDLHSFLGFRELFVGYNFRFGYGNEGDVEALKRLSSSYTFRLEILPPYRVDEELVSSSRIREAIRQGDVELAERMLGRKFYLKGLVSYGGKIGEEIGYPTANISVTDQILPKYGVYATKTSVRGSIYKSMTYVGMKPTVCGLEAGVETHLFRFEGNIYGEEICVNFLRRIREERRFVDLGELRYQLESDRAEVERYLKQI